MAEKATGRTRLRDIDWKPIAKNMAVVGAGTLAGHTLGGAATHLAAQKGPLKSYLQSMPPEQRAKVLRRAGAVAGGFVYPAALGAQTLASQVHLYHSAKRRERDEKRQGEKTASVILVYETALKGLL